MRRMLERMMPDATWDDIKARYPGFVRHWKPGYEPLPLNKTPTLEHLTLANARPDSDHGA